MKRILFCLLALLSVVSFSYGAFADCCGYGGYGYYFPRVEVLRATDLGTIYLNDSVYIPSGMVTLMFSGDYQNDGTIKFTIENINNHEDKHLFTVAANGGQQPTFQVYGGIYHVYAYYRTYKSYSDFYSSSNWSLVMYCDPDGKEYLNDYHRPGYDYHRLSNVDKMKADVYSPPTCCGYGYQYPYYPYPSGRTYRYGY